MRAIDPLGLSHTRLGFMRGAQAICTVAGLAWFAAVVVLFLIPQEVHYTVCSETLVHFPPPSVHWPPEGHNLQLFSLEHDFTLVAVGATIIGVFLVLYASPELSVPQRTGRLVAGIGLSLLLAALLWMAGEYYDLRAHLDAVGSCL